MPQIDPFLMGQIASAVTALLALLAAALLKSVRLRTWCTRKIAEVLGYDLDDVRYAQRNQLSPDFEIADLQERVRRLEEMCDELRSDLRRDNRSQRRAMRSRLPLSRAR